MPFSFCFAFVSGVTVVKALVAEVLLSVAVTLSLIFLDFTGANAACLTGLISIN